MRPEQGHRTLVRIWTEHRVRFVLAAMLPCQTHGYAQLGPQPPCGKEPIPRYPGLDDSAIAKSWNKSELGRDWRPPACTGWTALGFTSLVTTVARFSLYLGSSGLASPLWGNFRTQGHALLIDHSQAVANANCGRPRSYRVAPESTPRRFHTR